MSNNVIKLPNAYHLTELKKCTDQDLLVKYKSICHAVAYYDNADSFEQSYFEREMRETAVETKRVIEDFIRRFRPKLKGHI